MAITVSGSEVAFEYLLFAEEVTAGTPVNPPTQYAGITGLLTPQADFADFAESDGTLAEFSRSEKIHEWATLQGDGALDVDKLIYYARAVLNGSVSTPTTPTDAVLARLWSFPRLMSSPNRTSLTFYSGDPNVQDFQGAFGVVTELGISGDASGNNGATMSINATTKQIAATGASSVPTYTMGKIVLPSDSQVWIDTTSAIGTTEITDGRFVKADATLRSGIAPKILKTDGYDRVGFNKVTHDLNMSFEFFDLTQYNLFKNSDYLKVRWRMNGPLIETITGTPNKDFYYYVQLDFYGKATAAPGWSDLNGTNRVLDLSLSSRYSTYARTAGYDVGLFIQTTKTAL